MAENSKIEWTDHTFNPWRGCTKVSEGCKFCYAETLSGRNPGTLGVWGPKGTRVVASESMWAQPLKWNREAEKTGTQTRVFCASLADVFEGRDTMPEESWEAVEAARLRLFALIRLTPHLTWLLLTKRPENIHNVIFETLAKSEGQDPEDNRWLDDFPDTDLGWWLNEWTGGDPPANVWLGTSVENQKAADERIPELLKVPAVVRFLSCEPLLGPVDLTQWLADFELSRASPYGNLSWVIAGGESGKDARVMHPDWARSLRDQCEAAGVPFLFKQWGEWALWDVQCLDWAVAERLLEENKIKLKTRMMPDGTFPSAGTVFTQKEMDDYMSRGAHMVKIGKKAAGRLLDGVEHNGFPETEVAK